MLGVGRHYSVSISVGPKLTRMICIPIFKAKLHSLSLRILCYTKALAMLSSVQEAWCFRAC